ncbi:hypothetical protein F7D95_04565 [Prevotella copri]|uniref:Major fimbrial subunit protein N-terminal domain-containing protein n=1 Tax=Segatella copri TaxID=165179 RepID=A0AA90UE91_9BACT|nr:hypothetical protein [Segatella copri]MQN12105.1 hypothetical protein [Segatella copri]
MFLALAAGSLLFSACSSDDAILNGNAQDGAAQQIVLQVTSGGDGLTTRAGRPLYSSAALQAIDNVRVLVYKDKAGATDDKTIVYDSQKSLDWTKSLEYDTNGHGRRLTITLKGKDKIEDAGDYKIVAVGYSNNSDYTFEKDVKAETSLKGKPYSDITATLAAGKDAEEVFAGEAKLTIDADKKISNKTNGEDGVAVTLHRQVAGGFGYFMNIPAHINGVEAKTLRLVVRSKNDVLTFNSFNSDFTTSNNNLKYVVNGSTSKSAPTSDANFSNNDAAYTLYSIDLTKWFPGGDKNKDGFLNKDDNNWTHLKSVKVALVKGSVFAGKFIVPFALTAGKNTMELQLLDKDKNILKVWNVTIPEANKTDGNGVKDESLSVFNVVRNHMYNIGVKVNQNINPGPGKPDPDPTPGPDPDPVTPNPGTDQPEDLSKGQNLVLKVNDNWETIHQLVIE